MFSMDSASGDINGRGTLSAYIDIEQTSCTSVEHTVGKLLMQMADPEQTCVEYLLFLTLHASDFVSVYM